MARKDDAAGVGSAVKDGRKPATRVKAGTLAAALRDVLGVVSGRATIPILDNVLFVAMDGRIELTTSDLDMWVRRDFASDDRDGPGGREWLDSIRGFSVAVPAKALAAVVGKFDSDAMVTIEGPQDLTETYSGQITVKAGRARFKLHCLPAVEFPRVPPVGCEAGFAISCSQLADAFAAVEHAMSSEETRYYLNGIYMHPHELDLRFATTDGHRLARLAMDGPDGAASFPGVIVARRTVGVLDKLLASAVKAADEHGSPPMVDIEAAGASPGSLVRWAMPAGDGGDIEVVAKTIDGTFPDCDRVIPSAPPLRAVIGRAMLAEAIGRVAVLAATKTRAVKAEFSRDLVRLLVASPELGEAVEEVPCSYDGDELSIGFDARYWGDALSAIASDDVVMGMTDAGGPARVCGHADGGETGLLVQVVMPTRV